MKFFKFLSLFFVITLSTSLYAQKFQYRDWTFSKQNSFQEITQKNLTPEIEKTNNITATYKEKKISLDTQLVNGIPVLNSFIKKVSLSDKTELYQTNTLDKKTLSTESNFKFKKVNFENEIKKNITLAKKIEIISENETYVLENGRLTPYTLVNYFDSIGTPFTAYFTQDGKFSKNVRQGSQLAETHAMVYTTSPKLTPPTEVILENLKLTPTVSNELVLVTSDSDKKIQQITENLKFDSKDDRFDQIQVFYYINNALSWMQKELSVKLTPKIEAVVYIGYPEKTNSAFYFQNKIRIGRGDEVNYSLIAHDPSIVYHESFHAMIDNLSQLSFEGEGGSLNEAFADFFTCLMLDKPTLADSSYLKGPYKRSLLTTYKLDEATGGLYHDSLIFSGLLWELKEKLGPEKTKLLAMETLIQLNSLSKFSDFNNKILFVSKGTLTKDELEVFQQTLKSRGFRYE